MENLNRKMNLMIIIKIQFLMKNKKRKKKFIKMKIKTYKKKIIK